MFKGLLFCVVVFLSTLFLSKGYAQNKFSLAINTLPKPIKLSYTQNFSDSLQLLKQVDSVLLSIKIAGYFNANVAKYAWVNKQLTVNIYMGNAYKFTKVINANVNPIASTYLKQLENKQWEPKELKTLYNSVLTWYENNGYPFAQVWLDSFLFVNQAITAKLYCNPNKKFNIDTLTIVGNAKLAPQYLYACLDIKPGDTYQENKIALINKRLQNLNIVNYTKTSEVVFSGNRANINVFINHKNANQFDGVIGFLPSSTGNKLQLTGDFKLKLQNAFKRGELIDLNYRGLPNQTQQLLTKINYPYLFISKIGFDFDFQLYKKDTTFLNLNTKLGFSYFFSPEKSIAVFVENYKGNLISTIKKTLPTSLPQFTNISSTFYGLSTNLEKTDNILIPKKGFKLNLAASVGQRRLNNTQGFSPQDINANSTQYKLNADLSYYLKLTPKSNLLFRNQLAYLSGKNVFENEAYRIGGFKTLRGFDEQSILVSSYTVQTIEARYFIDKNSFIFTFFDQALVKQSFTTGQKSDIPAGFGAGLTFETKLGNISLMYALGKQQNIPINLRTGKIHFGLVSYF